MKISLGTHISSFTVLNIKGNDVICECICGRVFSATKYEVMFGKVRSCGCLSYEGEEYLIKLFRYYDKYNRSAKYKGHEFNLDINEFVTLINSRCHYCGSHPNHTVNVYGKKLLCNGIDRVNSEKGYCIDNVVTSCRICNYSKRDSSYDSYIEQNNKIYNNFFYAFIKPKSFTWVDPRYYKILHSLIKGSAKGKKIPFELSIAETINLISQPCFYCGEGYTTVYVVNSNKKTELHLNGIDRINSIKGYINGNVLPCCKTCNFMKREYPFTKFLNQVKLIHLWRTYGSV